MKTDYKYILEKGPRKHICPDCEHKTFVKYIDTSKNEHLPDNYGRCDREIKCGYFLNPYLDGYLKGSEEEGQNWKPKKVEKSKPSFIPYHILEKSFGIEGYDSTFIENLLNHVSYPLEVEDVEKVKLSYFLGVITKGYRAGAVTFPFIDYDGNVRTIQVKQFDNSNHTIGTGFIHSMIKNFHERRNIPLPPWLEAYLKNDLYVSCLFGEHLLGKYPDNPIALVEAPKTAIYSTLYFGFPEDAKNFLWLAVYNVSSLNYERSKVLKGRSIVLFPDLGAYTLWNKKAIELSIQMPDTSFVVSDLLERNATIEEKERGYDLADYLIKQDWRDFRQHSNRIESFVNIYGDVCNNEINKGGYPVTFDI